ncbi:peptidylprolyl isomerase [Spirulina sp. CS-785/01]|uniref:peptidylprolyl isomerase n=1 Tax=Spirulina sp. CS-785/01 TaxID=3021716 RepID=UPI00232F1970|nr:peptidylprolyl isomerase [Spirulina sp. CS-785/01]MDB9313480.1 peptidylprolyl isomerase [Spirulina sp. CS-785/01]
MKFLKIPSWIAKRQQVWRGLAIALLFCLLWASTSQPSWAARKSQLAQGNAVTDPTAILRYALPIDNEKVYRLQASLENIAYDLRSKRWSQVNSDIKNAALVLDYGQDKILKDIPQDRQETAKSYLEELNGKIDLLQEAAKNKDKEAVWTTRREMLNTVTELEKLMVTGFPFEIPEEFADLPQLKGRATVKIETNRGPLKVRLDGYSAPINAGNFVDLVQRGFYDGLEFFQNQDFILQTGDPPGPEEGFIDPETGEYRAIPLEVLVEGEDKPLYQITMENAGLYLERPVLPFNAYGALALARPGDNPNGGSSQVFFFLFDSELTPPGFNLMDGRYSVFGYLIDGKEVLEKLKPGDKIISAEVIEGSENLVNKG